MSSPSIETRHDNGDLPTTRWSIVRAMGADESQRRRALEVFAKDYWPAVYAFARKKGHRPEDAEDLTQAFLSELIERESFADLSSDKGRFRSWLLACLHNYLRSDWKRSSRLKRGGGAVHLSIDHELAEQWLQRADTDDLSPEVIFDRRWASGILDRAFRELGRAHQRDGKERVWEVLLPMIAAPDDRQSYAEAARELEISEPNARMAAFRMRKKLRELVRDEVAATVADPDEIDDELGQLFAIFASTGRRGGA